MAILEADSAFILLHETDKALQECGLIAVQDMERFECAPFEDQEMELFDALCDSSTAGKVVLDNSEVHLDRYPENGNILRSVDVPTEQTDEGTWYQSYNLITHRNGKTYFETHLSFRDIDGNLHEPAVGSEAVQPDSGTDIVMHYRVAYGATPLQQAA